VSSRVTANSANGCLQKVNNDQQCATVRAESEQVPEGAPTVNSDCPVHHRTVRWPHMSGLQRSEPNDLVTWLAHRTVSGGAPDCPMRHTTEALTNSHFGGWGYKYPPTTTLQCIQVFSHQTSCKSSRLHSKTQTKRSNPLPKSGITPNKLVTRERETFVFF
jgi:hypothetical protein